MAGTERAQPLLLHTQPADRGAEQPEYQPREPVGTDVRPLIIAGVLGAFWIGAAGAWAWGYFGPNAMFHLNLEQLILFGFGALMPPVFMIATAWAFTRGQAMASAAAVLADATDRFFAVDETASRRVARLGRTVRHELDALNVGMDGAFSRLRALESVLETQIAALDEAGARADVRAESASSRLAEERERMDAIATQLIDSASRASEMIAGRAAQLKAMVESAEGSLRTLGQSLETHGANFQAAASAAAEAPHSVALELDKQAKRIESVADATMARAEFVLGRHERHRAAMSELLLNLKGESEKLEAALVNQQGTMEQAFEALSVQADKFEGLASNADRDLELIMVNAATRATQISQGFAREVEGLKQTSEDASAMLAKIVDTLREAGLSAQTLICESAAESKNSTKVLVGEAMGECERLLRAAAELTHEAREIKISLAATTDEIHQHVVSLPGVARQEAQRVRELVRAETEEMLDHSARTLATIHARTTSRAGTEAPADAAAVQEENPNAGLLSLARRLTQRQKRKEPEAKDKSWDMRALLTAADGTEGRSRDESSAVSGSESGASLVALQAILTDIAIDLDGISLNGAPGEDEWRRYVAGDRGVFVRRIAGSIDAGSVDRIAALYRENLRFREAANAYLEEFEILLDKAKASDTDGLFTATILGADTGKIYLAIAYALGRLSA